MSRRPCLPQPRAEAVLDFCLAAECVELDEPRWIERVARAALPLLPRSDDYAAASVAIDPESGFWSFGQAFMNGDLPLLAGERAGNTEITSSERNEVRTMTGVRSFRSARYRMPQLIATAEAHGIYELACVMASSPRGVVTLFVHLDEELEVAEHECLLWAELAQHLTRTSQLRHAIASTDLADADAVFSPEGSCMHARPHVPRPTLERLRARVLARERIRAQQEDDVARVLACWTDDAALGWTVVDHFERDGERWVVVWPNPMAQRGPRALDLHERRMLALVLEGASNRAAANELGMSFASASRTLSSALRKLGLRDLAALSSWRSCELAGEVIGLPLGTAGLVAMGVPHVGAEAVGRLTSSERAVLGEIVRGRTNRQIGSLRGTSERTVANQVRSIFDKLGVGSRRELLHRIGVARAATN